MIQDQSNRKAFTESQIYRRGVWIFYPSLIVPFLLIATTGPLLVHATIPIIGTILSAYGLWPEDWPQKAANPAGFITVMGAFIVLITRFHRCRRTWERAQGMTQNISLGRIRREIAYLLDYVHVPRMMEDRINDKTIEAEKLSDKAGTPDMIPFHTTVLDIIRQAQEEKRVEEFLTRSYGSFKISNQNTTQVGTARNPRKLTIQNIPNDPHISKEEKNRRLQEAQQRREEEAIDNSGIGSVIRQAQNYRRPSYWP